MWNKKKRHIDLLERVVESFREDVREGRKKYERDFESLNRHIKQQDKTIGYLREENRKLQQLEVEVEDLTDIVPDGVMVEDFTFIPEEWEKSYHG